MMAWIVCPNLWGARLFATDNPDDPPRFLRELPRPSVQLRNEDMERDEDIPELTETKEDHEERVRVAQTYSALIAHFLEHACHQHGFDSLVICAEPQFLHILLGYLSPGCRKRVIGTIEEDLYEVNETDLANYLQDFRKKLIRPGAA